MENGADRPGTLEDEVAAVFDLLHHVEPVQATTSGALLGGKLRRHNKRPVVNSLLKRPAVQPVGHRLELCGVGHRHEPVVLFDEFDSLADQFSLDEIVTIEIGRHRKGQE